MFLIKHYNCRNLCWTSFSSHLLFWSASSPSPWWYMYLQAMNRAKVLMIQRWEEHNELLHYQALYCRADPLHSVSRTCNATTMHYSSGQHIPCPSGSFLFLFGVFSVPSGPPVQPTGCATQLLVERGPGIPAPQWSASQDSTSSMSSNLCNTLRR